MKLPPLYASLLLLGMTTACPRLAAQIPAPPTNAEPLIQFDSKDTISARR